MKTLFAKLAALAVLLVSTNPATAQVASYTGGTLTENFDSMGATGANTPPGWSVGWHNGFPPGTAGAVVRTTNVTVNNGTTAPSGAIAGFNCGTNDASAGLDRSLGTGPTSTSSPNGTNRFIEVQIQNNSGQTLDAINVIYVGKQWRTSSSTSSQNFTNYLQFGTDGVNYAFMGAAFDFRAPVVTPASTPLNGNLPANYRTNLGGTYGLPNPVPAGGTIYLRWLDVNDPSTDPVLAIDNFAFSAANFQPVAILAEPQDAVKTAGEPATFSMSASGVPIYYQWLSNGVPLSGANSSNYTIVDTTTNLSGTGFSVIVSNSLNSLTSRVATLTVFPDLSQMLVSLTNPVWHYDQSGADLGDAWKEPGHNDTAWPSGHGVLALENNALVTPLTNTMLSLTNTTGDRIITYYFRTHFTLANDPASVFLTFSNLIDDGCVVYLNGAEVYRLNLPSTSVTAPTLALAAATEGVFVVTNLWLPATLIRGDNVLAVEVHQNSTTSSDVVMGLAVKAQPLTSGPVVIWQHPQNQTVNAGSSVAFSVLASGYGPLAYQWRFNGNTLPGQTNANLTLNAVGLEQDGFYSVEVSDPYSSTRSFPARLDVTTSQVVFYFADFENGAGGEWSRNITEVTPIGGRHFLGQFGKQPVSLALDNLPPHTNLTISLDLFVIRTWDGSDNNVGPDIWSLRVSNGPTLLETTFNNNRTPMSPSTIAAGQAFPYRYPWPTNPPMTGASETNSLGYVETAYLNNEILDAIYHLRYSCVHSRSNITFEFVGGTSGPLTNESWGLDNVKVYLSNHSGDGWPVILAQPQGQVVPPGSNAVLTVTAVGAGPLSYQWSKDGQPVSDDVRTSGATTAALTIRGVSSDDLGAYTVVVSNNRGTVRSIVAALVALAPDFAWAVRDGGTDWDGIRGIAVDGAGNVYGAGVFRGSGEFGTSTLTSAGNLDMLVGKYDRSGKLQWVRQVGGANSDVAQGIAVDAEGHCYVVGQFRGPAVFSTTNVTGWTDVAMSVAKYAGDGALEWVRTAGGTGGGVVGYGAAVDKTGHCLVTGDFYGTVAFGSTVLSSAGWDDLFVAKYRPDGTLEWVQRFGGSALEQGFSIRSDADNNFYLAGVFNGTFSLGASTLTAAGGMDSFLARFDSGGNASWATSMGGPGEDWVAPNDNVAVDGLGNCLVAGRFNDTAWFGPTNLTSHGNSDLFCAKYSPAGILQWVKQVGVTDSDGSNGGIGVDAWGNCYLGGNFKGTADFGGVSLSSAGNTDFFVAKYRPDGTLRSIQRSSGLGWEYCYGFTTDAFGGCYVTGEFQNTAVIGTNNLVCRGANDLFIATLGGALAVDASTLAVTNGVFHMQVTGGASVPVALEASFDLQQWEAISTNTSVNGTMDFTIPLGAYPHRFFRAKQMP